MISNIYYFKTNSADVKKEQRDKQVRNHKGIVLWFTGMAGVGKTSVAYALDERLYGMGCVSYVLDSEHFQSGCNNQLNNINKYRHENILRAARVSKLYVDSNVIVLASIPSEFRKDRLIVENIVHGDDLCEIYCDSLSQTSHQRRCKDVYFEGGEDSIANSFETSAGQNYPAIVVFTDVMSVEESVDLIILELEKRGVI